MEMLLTQDLGHLVAPMNILVIHQSSPIVPCFAYAAIKLEKQLLSLPTLYGCENILKSIAILSLT